MRLLLPAGILAAATILALLLAYQVRPTYDINMNASFDRVYLAQGFYDQEGSGDAHYRWMSGQASVQVKGAGSQPLRLVMRLGTDAQDPQQGKPLEIHARGALVAIFQVANAPATFEATIPPELISRATGDLTLTLTTDTFTPAQDSRELGAAISTIRIEPMGGAGLLLPPLLHGFYVLGIALCIYLVGAMLGLRSRWRLGVALGAIGIMGLLYAFARPYLSFYAGALLLAFALSTACLAVARPLVTRLYRRGGLHDFSYDKSEARLLFAIFVAGLLVAWGGLLYPLSAPNDFGFHLHRFQEVQGGNLFFENYVVAGVGVGFYPPAMYVLLLPFSLIVDPYFLLRLVPPLLDFAGVFLIFYLCKRYLGRYRAAPLLAAALYAVVPINLLVLWWSHLTNLFGLLALFATAAYLVLNYDRLVRFPVWLGLTALSFVVFLSHPAVLAWGLGLLGGVFVLFLALRKMKGLGSYKAALLMGSSLVAAAALAFVLYYARYLGAFGKVAAAATGGAPAEQGSDLDNPAEILARAQLTFRHGFLLDYGLWPLLLVPIGLWLLFRKRAMQPEGSPDATHYALRTTQHLSTLHTQAGAERFRWVVAVWVALGAFLLVADQVTGLPDRPMLFLWPVVSILAGLALAALVEGELREGRLRWRGLLVGLLVAGLAVMSLYFWAQANFLDQREPHIFPHVF